MSQWFKDLQSLQSNSATLAQSFIPEEWAGSNAVAVVDAVENIIRSWQAVRSLAVHRVEATNGFVDSEHRDAASWVASRTGASKSDAAKQLATGRRMADLPDVDRAFRSGQLSSDQAERIARAGEADPGSVKQLLNTAFNNSLHVLDEEAKRVVAAKSAAEEQRQRDRQQRRRRFGMRTDEDGCVNFWGTLLPEEGAELDAVWRKRRDKVFQSARKNKRFDSYNQYDADAFMSIVRDANASGGAKTSAHVQVIVDYDALKRGYRETGETCEIPGIGEIAVASLYGYLDNAWAQLLVTEGKDVRTITSKKRYVPAMLNSALQFRDRRCAVPGCNERLPIERDHRHPHGQDGDTSYDNMDRLCRFHHAQKTYKGWGFKLVGSERRWVKLKDPPGDPPELFDSA